LSSHSTSSDWARFLVLCGFTVRRLRVGVKELDTSLGTISSPRRALGLSVEQRPPIHSGMQHLLPQEIPV